MTNLEILSKGNEVVKDAKFTTLLKPTLKNDSVFLIVACGSGLCIYGSYCDNIYYAQWEKNWFQFD